MDKLSIEDRRAIIKDIEEALASGDISLGAAIKRIRTELYGMNQAHYAKFLGVADRTLRDIEKGKTDPRLSIIEKLLAPAGLRLSAKAVNHKL